MVFGLVPGSVATDGNLLIAWLPENGIADVEAPTVAELSAATLVDLTYSLTTSGYNRTSTQAADEDPRLTLAEVLQTPGRVTHSLELQYVHGSDTDVADAVLVDGARGFIVERRAVDIETAVTAGQIVDVIPVTVGFPKKDAPTANGKFTKSATLYVRGKVGTDVAVTA